MILVTGGTGTLGAHVVPLLRRAGHEVRILSRGHGADLATGRNVDAALAGVHTVLHLAGSRTGDGDKARTLVRAAERAGRPHLVHISVVGCERIPVRTAVDRGGFGYFAEKRDAELVIENSALPWTMLRATQFHDLTRNLARGAARLPVMPAFAGVHFQPVDTAEVAARLVGLALGEPAGLVPELAGPRPYAMAELFRTYLRATGRRRAIVSLRGAGGAYRAVRSGANLPLAGADLGTVTWEDFLSTAAQSTR
ncbi:NAD(P)H-binding protein [Paractinoplanes ferrugineus]|uniref:NmrA family transcriptional regulator n=1 Tax=Paractinoplanes ferrugineus TaxID=113564 RepID=A0A919IZY5_9ACTN|nr:SDR family oxidoreductase [Actinoplanes ferrugineus]GIE11333.1 NmrA family transcriptional regulator [Actinoplanes ferrugineus]